jgi:SNF2 family DNA or RNA helicase
MMEIINYDNNFIYLTAKTKEANAIGAHYLASKKAFRVPLTVKSIEEITKYTSTKSISELYQSLVDNKNKLLEIKKKSNPSIDPGLLRPYQAVDVEFLTNKDSAAVFNEQRTGKTPTILTTIKDAKKVIVVCPSSLKTNWNREIDDWVEPSKTAVVKGSKNKRYDLYNKFNNTELRFLVMGYETLRQDIDHVVEVIKDIDVLIVDEAHRLRNYKSKQSKALYRLRRLSKRVFPMTGTPAVNHPSDVFGILKLLEPDKYTSYWQFIERYFGYNEGRFGRELLDVRKDREDEFQEILETNSVQRKRRDVMRWIPKIMLRDIYIDLNDAQKRHIKKITEEFMVGDIEIPNVIAQITRLRQVSLDPGLLELNGKSAKTEFIKDFLEDNDGKVVIFSAFTSYLKRLKEELSLDCALLTGEQTQEEKQAAVDAVQLGSKRVLLSNIQVGGTGWTLDNIDTIIFTDRSFNPIDNAQAEDRIVPTNPNKVYGAKQIITLIAEDSIEKNIERLLKRKINIIKFVNDYGMNALVELEKGENNNGTSIHNKR